jgi:AcrR family transcriptional regulator
MIAKTNSASDRTRLQIILAAERLFGEQGIDAVSLRQVNVEAGQKNSSATHYHFGNKETLVTAIYDYRMASVNQRRLKMLAHSEQEDSLRSLIEAMVYPIVDEIDGTEGGPNYIRFLSQMIGNPAVDLNALWASKHGTGLNIILKRIQKLLPDMPMAILGQRFGLAAAQTFHSLADRERLRVNPAIDFTKYGALFAANLIDTQTGAFGAPVSSVTYKELQDVERNAS